MEIVQKRMETMSSEIAQMRRTKLLNSDECKKVLKMRKQFEYKISGISKNLPDFQAYIEYEMGLLKTLRFRRSAKKIGEKMGDIEHKIINRIKDLYETTLQRFPDDTTLCLAYFKFCKQANYVNAASVAVSNMIKNHSHNVEIWQVAAKWHAYDRKDTSTALNVICKGLAKHKTSKLLYTEAIQLEVHTALGSSWQTKPEDNLTDKQKLCLEKLQTYIREIANYVNESEYYVQLLEYLEEYSFTEPVQNTIIEYLMKDYAFEALTWNVLAQRDRKGLSNPIDKQAPVGTTTKMKLIKCIDRYKQGLSKVPVSEKEQLWSLYINCMIDATQEEGVATVFKSNSLKEAFEQASAEGYLFEKYYKQWLELVGDDKKAEVMEIGIAKFPQSIELWKLYLKMEILADNREGVEKVFVQGVTALRERALPLWMGVIRYHLLSSDDDVIEKIYQEGVKQPQQVSDVLKPHFIEWLALARGVDETREQYFALAIEKPYCKELHSTMSKLESTEIKFNFEVWDHVHRLAREQFGKEDVDVWLNSIQYYVDYKQENVSKDVILQIYNDAKKSLPEVLFLDFNDKYLAMTNK